MKHDRIKKADWNLIANKKLDDAEVTKVWKDTEGNIHIELTLIRPQEEKSYPTINISREDLFTNRPDMISVIRAEMESNYLKSLKRKEE